MIQQHLNFLIIWYCLEPWSLSRHYAQVTRVSPLRVRVYYYVTSVWVLNHHTGPKIDLCPPGNAENAEKSLFFTEFSAFSAFSAFSRESVILTIFHLKWRGYVDPAWLYQLKMSHSFIIRDLSVYMMFWYLNLIGLTWHRIQLVA